MRFVTTIYLDISYIHRITMQWLFANFAMVPLNRRSIENVARSDAHIAMCI